MIKNPFIHRQLLLITLLLAVCLAVFFNALSGEFIWDDYSLITDNHYIKSLANIPLFFRPHYWNHLHPFVSPQITYRPLRTVSFAVDYALWGANPAGYHLTNLLLHLANVILVFYLAAVISRRSDENGPEQPDFTSRLMGLPFLTALFFAVHPVHTENIAYIKNRSDLLAGLFFLAAGLLFIKGRAVLPWRSRVPLLAGSWLCFTLALLSKEMALTLPALLVLYALCFQDGTERVGSFVRVIPYGLMAFFFIWFCQATLVTTGLSPKDYGISGAGSHALAVVKTIGSYLTLLAFPVNLQAERAFSIPESIRDADAALSLAALMLIGFMTVKAWRRSRVFSYAIGWIFLTLLPVANILLLGTRPVAEQRLYIPSFGFCLLLAGGINYLYRRGVRDIRPKMVTAAWLITGLIVAGYGVIAIDRNSDWADPITFYTETVRSNPGSFRIQNNLGEALAEQGRLEEAIVCFQNALRLEPDNRATRNNLGVALAALGRFKEAITHYEKVLRVDPGNDMARNNIGIVLFQTGRIEEAIGHYQSAVKLNPDNYKARYNLGLAYAAAGRPEEAMDCYRAVLRLNPDFKPAFDRIARGASTAEDGRGE